MEKEFGVQINDTEILKDIVCNHIADAVIFINKHGEITLANRVAQNILGISKPYTKNQKYENRVLFFHKNGNVVSPSENPITKSLLEKKDVSIPFSKCYFCKNKKGHLYPIIAKAEPVNLQGQFTGVVVKIRNMTDDVKKDDIVNDILTIASHQLKTPLAIASLHLEMLLSGHIGKLTKDQYQYIKEIYFDNKKIQDLIQMFLIISKAGSQRFTPRNKEFDANEHLKDVVHELIPQSKIKKQHIKCCYEATDLAYADPTLLRIVIHNIISNAIKYTPIGGCILIGVRKYPNGEGLEFFIVDSGEGISEEEKNSVFRKLYRGKDAVQGHQEGTGLGLHIAKSFIKKIGGKIWFESTKGKGTAFHVTVPTYQKTLGF